MPLVFDTPEKVNAYRLIALKHALRLETKGMRTSKWTTAAIQVRATMGVKTKNKRKLLAQYEEWLRVQGVGR